MSIFGKAEKLPRVPEFIRRPRDLDDEMNEIANDYARRPVAVRTSQAIADEIDAILAQLKSAEQIIADTREALKQREAELIAKCDEEAAAAKETYEAEIGRVERLRPKAGGE